MKAKIGNKTTNLPKDVISSHMANLITTRSIVLGHEKDFKESFGHHKKACDYFLKHNKNFVYSFGDEDWFEDFVAFQIKQRDLELREASFSFSDGTEWSVYLTDLAHIKMNMNPSLKNMSKILAEPEELIKWAEDNLNWQDIQELCMIRKIKEKHDLYTEEWKNVKKEILDYEFTDETEN